MHDPTKQNRKFIMTQFLPANLLALFTARPAIPFKPPPDGLKKKKNAHPYLGVSEFMSGFETTEPPPATRGETRDEKEERKKVENKARCESELEDKLLRWDPHADVNATGDPFKTLYVARINYDTTESKLRRELETYGPIKRIAIVYSGRSRRPRGFAFVEYEHERDMHSAYKHADGKKIDGRRILVDVERGRTVKSWRPRRLGGGLGGTRLGGPDDNIRHSGRVEQWESRGGSGGGGGGAGGGSDAGDKDRERDREERRERRRSRSPRERKERERGERGGDRDRERRRDRSERDDRDGEREQRRRERRERGERGERGDRENRSDRERPDRDRGREDRSNNRQEEGEIKTEDETTDYPTEGYERNREQPFDEAAVMNNGIKQEPIE